MKPVPAALFALLPLMAASSLHAQPALQPAPKANAAVIWKWRDAQGHVVASDRAPPVDVPESRILQRPGGLPAAPAQAATYTGPAGSPISASPRPAGQAADTAAMAAAAGSAPGASGVDPQLEARRRKAKEEADAQAQQAKEAASRKQAADKADSCRRARANLAALESGRRISRPNDKGEPEVLDDAARGAEVERTRRIVASSCG